MSLLDWKHQESMISREKGGRRRRQIGSITRLVGGAYQPG